MICKEVDNAYKWDYMSLVNLSVMDVSTSLAIRVCSQPSLLGMDAVALLGMTLKFSSPFQLSVAQIDVKSIEEATGWSLHYSHFLKACGVEEDDIVYPIGSLPDLDQMDS